MMNDYRTVTTTSLACLICKESVLRVDLHLSNDLTVSVLLLLSVSADLLYACDFSVLLTVSIYFLMK